MTRKSNRQERRQQIMASFQKLVISRGYDRATIAEIATNAGLTTGLVHYHFRSKEAILLALISHLESVLDHRFAQIETQPEDPEATLKSLLAAYLSLKPGASREAIFAWIMIAAEAAKKAEIRVHFEAAMAKQAMRITQLLQEILPNTPTESGIKPFTAGLLAAIHGCFLMAMASPGCAPQGFALPWAWQLCKRFIESERQQKS